MNRHAWDILLSFEFARTKAIFTNCLLYRRVARFSNKKIQVCYTSEGLEMEYFGIFYDHLVGIF
jgi:hypothetical protein